MIANVPPALTTSKPPPLIVPPAFHAELGPVTVALLPAEIESVPLERVNVSIELFSENETEPLDIAIVPYVFAEEKFSVPPVTCIGATNELVDVKFIVPASKIAEPTPIIVEPVPKVCDPLEKVRLVPPVKLNVPL